MIELGPAEVAGWLAGRVGGRGRRLVGLAGPPGAGKSTLAARLAEQLPGPPPVVAMDGFHLAGSVLEAAGTADRKGAPETFDAAGLVVLLERLRASSATETVWAPRFDRDLEEPIAGAVAVHPADELVLVEGNYLLLDRPPWDRVRPLLDLCVFLDPPAELRVERLVARHVHHGRAPAAARRWVEESDERNARLVMEGIGRADAVVRPGP